MTAIKTYKILKQLIYWFNSFIGSQRKGTRCRTSSFWDHTVHLFILFLFLQPSVFTFSSSPCGGFLDNHPLVFMVKSIVCHESGTSGIFGPDFNLQCEIHMLCHFSLEFCRKRTSVGSLLGTLRKNSSFRTTNISKQQWVNASLQS